MSQQSIEKHRKQARANATGGEQKDETPRLAIKARGFDLEGGKRLSDPADFAERGCGMYDA